MTPVEPVRRRTAESQEVSRGHSTEKPFGKDRTIVVLETKEEGVMQRPQKTARAGCPCEGMVETESNREACSIALTETDRKDGAEELIERILDRNNLNKSYFRLI